MILLQSPTRALLEGYESKGVELGGELTYIDKKVDWEIQSHFSGRKWFVLKYGEEAFTLRLRELKASRSKSLLFNEQGMLWTYSGLASQLGQTFGDEMVRGYDLPKPRSIPWAHVPTGEDRYYQSAAEDKLIEAAAFGPAGVEMGTGLGKSRIIRNLVKRLGLKTVVMAPSKNIAEQLYDDLVHHFGKAKVGMVGDGKKQYGKMITVAIAASLTRIEPDSEVGQKFLDAQIQHYGTVATDSSETQ